MSSTDPVRAIALVPGSRAGAVGQRRVARAIPARSPRWVVLEVVRAALAPTWAPIDTAQALLVDVDDLQVLRRARARLRAASEDRMTLCVARALATLNTAVGLLEHDGDLAASDRGRPRGDGRPAS